MKKKTIEEVRDEVMKIIRESKATFFVSKGEKFDPKFEDVAYEMKAEIGNNVGLYFFNLLNK